MQVTFTDFTLMFSNKNDTSNNRAIFSRFLSGRIVLRLKLSVYAVTTDIGRTLETSTYISYVQL